MRVLITGANGFVGKRLLASLQSQGHAVLGMTRANADLANRQAVMAALHGQDFDVVFHVAAHIPKTAVEDVQCFDSNAVGTFNLLEALKVGTTRDLIYVSSTSVYGRLEVLPTPETHPAQPLEFYSLAKLMGEQLCESYARRYGFRCTILRPCGIHGPGRDTGVLAGWTKRALAGYPLKVSSPDSTKSFVHVDDVVQACLRAWQKLSETTPVYNVAPAEEVRLVELAECVKRVTGKNVPIETGDSAVERETYDVSLLRAELGLACRPAAEIIKDIARQYL